MVVLDEPRVYEFRAQTRELLALVIHSLYTQKEIFLRELISNASDAIDRRRFAALQTSERLDPVSEPMIVLDTDPSARVLTVSDNGIGMTRDELIANVGTIARSGTKELLDRLRMSDAETVPELIGRFGVGLYSAFMVADQVTIVSRHVTEAAATQWQSTGDGQFVVSDAERDEPGTSITLQLKPVNADSGIEDYTDHWVLWRIVKKHSDYIAHPIVLRNARLDDMFPGGSPERTTSAGTDRTLNSRTPVWARVNGSVSDDDYRECYRHITNDWNPPLLRLSARAEGRMEWQALLFVPQEAPADLYYHATPYGLQLYATRVLVVDRCAELLPRYLRFVRGVIDVLDVPLHISRQMLQERWQVERIQKWVARKVLDLLCETRTQDPGTYLTLWRQFGRCLKEGLGMDGDNRDRLLSLFLFESSHSPTDLATLDDYVARMKEGQAHIYYYAGDSREQIEAAPHLEAVRGQGLEVLYLTEPVDDLLMQSLPEYAGHRLQPLDRGRAELPGHTPTQPSPTDDAAFAPLTDRLAEALTEHVKSVRLSSRLTTSPLCLVGEEYDYTPRMERLLLKGKGGGPRQRRILELNPTHPLILGLNERARAADDPTDWAQCAALLLGYAHMVEGGEPVNSARFTRALADLLTRTLS